MLLIYASFIVLCLATCIYAWLRGGWEGRWSASLFIAAAFGGPLVIALPFFSKVTALLLVDSALLLGLTIIAFRTDRYWPLWLVGLHSLSVCAEIVETLEGRPYSRGFDVLQTFWSIPILLILACGVLLDRRADQRARHASQDDGLGVRHGTPEARARNSAQSSG